MKKFLYTTIAIISVLGIIFGHFFWNKNIEEQTATAYTTLEEKGYVKTKTRDTLRPSKAAMAQTADGTDLTAGNSDVSGSGDLEDKKKSTDEASKAGEDVDDEGAIDEATSDSSDDDGKKSLSQLKEKYNAAFQELEAEETSKVDQLVVQAKADYVSKKATKSELLAKYSQAATIMEQNADKAFNVLYQQFQYDLETQGYDISVADEYKAAYQNKKQARLDRVVEDVNSFKR